MLVERPTFGRDELRTTSAADVLVASEPQRQHRAYLLGGTRLLGTKRDEVPCDGAQAFFIRVGILDDQSGNTLRAPRRDTQSDGPAEVERVQHEAIELDHFAEAL